MFSVLTACGGGEKSYKSYKSEGTNYANTTGQPNQLSLAVKNILSSKCVGCHGTLFQSSSSLISAGFVVPGSPSASKLNTRVQNGTMPPTGPLDSNSKQLINQWIGQGAAGFKAVGLYDPSADEFIFEGK